MKTKRKTLKIVSSPLKNLRKKIVEGITAKKFNVGSEWIKHGRCTKLDPKEYFEWSKLLFEGIVVPKSINAGGDYTTQEITSAFVVNNNKLKPESVHVNSENNRNTIFSGISVCLDGNFDYTACTQVPDKNYASQKLFVNSSLSEQNANLNQDKNIKDNLNQGKNINVPGKFDYYVLALSWSPTHCQFKPNDKEQCGIKKSYRFVLHGLWPNYNKGYPASCQKNSYVDTVVADKIFPIMPSKKLIEHEWKKHGTCSGLDQKTYFNRSDELYHELKFPEFVYKNNISTITADDIIKEFKKNNPNLAKQDSIRVVAKKQKGKQVLQEIRICYNKEFNPLTCPSPRLTNTNTLLEIIPPKGSSLGDDLNKLVTLEEDENIMPKTVNLNLACKLQIQENNLSALSCVNEKI